MVWYASSRCLADPVRAISDRGIGDLPVRKQMEELWFRGIFLKKLNPFLGATAAGVATSLVFSLLRLASLNRRGRRSGLLARTGLRVLGWRSGGWPDARSGTDR